MPTLLELGKVFHLSFNLQYVLQGFTVHCDDKRCECTFGDEWWMCYWLCACVFQRTQPNMRFLFFAFIMAVMLSMIVSTQVGRTCSQKLFLGFVLFRMTWILFWFVWICLFHFIISPIGFPWINLYIQGVEHTVLIPRHHIAILI